MVLYYFRFERILKLAWKTQSPRTSRQTGVSTDCVTLSANLGEIFFAESIRSTGVKVEFSHRSPLLLCLSALAFVAFLTEKFHPRSERDEIGNQFPLTPWIRCSLTRCAVLGLRVRKATGENVGRFSSRFSPNMRCDFFRQDRIDTAFAGHRKPKSLFRFGLKRYKIGDLLSNTFQVAITQSAYELNFGDHSRHEYPCTYHLIITRPHNGALDSTR